MATLNSSSEPDLVERLAIDGLGARGDGIAASEAGAIYVPYTLPGEIVEVDPWPGQPDRRSLLRIEAASGVSSREYSSRSSPRRAFAR